MDEWDSTYKELGYEYCRPCREYHRPPECWIDQQGNAQLDLELNIWTVYDEPFLGGWK